MKELLSIFQENSLENLDGLWSIFDKLGSELGNAIAKGIDILFDAIEKQGSINNVK